MEIRWLISMKLGHPFSYSYLFTFSKYYAVELTMGWSNSLCASLSSDLLILESLISTDLKSMMPQYGCKPFPSQFFYLDKAWWTSSSSTKQKTSTREFSTVWTTLWKKCGCSETYLLHLCIHSSYSTGSGHWATMKQTIKESKKI